MFVQNTTSFNKSINLSTQRLAFKALPIKYQVVDDYLIRGPHPSISDLIQLKKEGVTQIFDFRYKELFSTKFIERIACNILGIKYKKEPYNALYHKFPRALAFEQIAQSVAENGKNGGKTLFHCNSGRHRTSHMCAFYEITKGEQTLNEARKTLGANFGERVKAIIHSQIPSKTYRNRSIIEYNGSNPIKRHKVEQNNRYAMASRRAQAMFMKLIFGLETP